MLVEGLNDIRNALHRDSDFVREPGLFERRSLGIVLHPGVDMIKELD